MDSIGSGVLPVIPLQPSDPAVHAGTLVVPDYLETSYNKFQALIISISDLKARMATLRNVKRFFFTLPSHFTN